MRLRDIHAEYCFDLRMKALSSDDVPSLGIGSIEADYSAKTYRLRIGSRQWHMALETQSCENDLNYHLRRGCAHLAEVEQIAKDSCVFVRIIFFNGETVDIGDVEVGIDERIEKTAKNNGLRFDGVEQLCGLLQEKCKISVGGEDYFIILSVPNADDEIDDEIDNNTEFQDQSFSICGERVVMSVERRAIDKFKEIFFAKKAIFRDKGSKERAFRLVKGKLTMSDYTKTGAIAALASGAMLRLYQSNSTYLKKWDEYGAIEGEMLLKRATSVGFIKYNKAEQTTKGVKFFVDYVPEILAESDEIEITDKLPLHLERSNITWNDYISALQEEFKDSKKRTSKAVGQKEKSIYAKIINISKNSLELDLPAIPSEKKFSILSINGEKIQIERRMRARQSIMEGRCANPILGLLIEEGAVVPRIQRVSKIKPLSSFVKSKIFKHDPTEKQCEAIDVALNTPDIALIQGPPGTGKTTVVAAILERINEEYDKTQSIRGQILVSGFQHDAVENIVSRLSINSLPSVKFGKRSTDSEFGEDAISEKINKWCENISDKIRTKNPQIRKTQDQLKLSELFLNYLKLPSKNMAMGLLSKILSMPRDIIPEDIIDEAKAIIDSMQSERISFDSTTVRLIRALRVTEDAFNDDGHSRATELLNRLEEKDDNYYSDTLEKASRWRTGKSLDFLPELKKLKESLLFKYLPVPSYSIEKQREDVLALASKVDSILKDRLDSSSKTDAILAEFLRELEDNPEGIREAVEDYNFVYAATTQQAVGKDIIRSKNKHTRIDLKTEMVKYDTVIIDEAARTSPRDLLIPMVQAEKRIILVGDHRQLPHLINEEIARLLESNKSSEKIDQADFVKKSMFEYLFKRLKSLEAEDGIKRTVTLDAQYRTHPLLGHFVSQNFYEKYSEGYRSPLSDKYFEQNLSGIERKAAVWIDVPHKCGKEERLESGSRKRVCEAKAIAKHLHDWINSEQASAEFMKKLTNDPNHPGLSFGVISFYKAQELAVYEELEKYGITQRMQDGSWQILPKYRFLENSEEKLRIGTVDAFQGMEFDVVFLSMVRSYDMDSLPGYIMNEQEYDKKQHKLFGHLLSENRLCVSMSRQKRVLAIVGDANFVRTQIAQEAVPSLKKYYELCREQGAIL